MSSVMELNCRAIALKQQGQFEAAVSCYEEAILLQPNFAEAHFNLALLWRDLGRLNQAINCLEKTVALRPDVVIAQLELGRLYLDQQQWSDAERLFDRLCSLQPDNLDVQLNLALSLHQQGKLNEAAVLYRKVLKTHPQHAVALTNLGHILKTQGHLDEAICSYKAAVAADPALAEAHSNLGNSWLESGKVDAAYSEYLIAVQLRPQDPRSHIDLGNALQRLERLSEAVQVYHRAIELDPDTTDGWLNTSHLLKEIGDFGQAAAVCRELSRRHPDEPIHGLRASAMCPQVFRDREEMQQFRNEFVDTANLLAGFDWNLEFARWTINAPECPYNLQFLDGNLKTLKEAFAKIYSVYFDRHRDKATKRTTVRDCPRIGFVVTGRHEAAFLKLLGGVVERLNGQRWELVILCSQFGADSIRSRLRRKDITLVAFPERFDHIVTTVQNADCDLLYYWEVGNDPTNYFLPFLRLAPVQVTSWGIQVTTGIPTLDAYLSSDLVEERDAAKHYTEKLIRGSTLLTYQTPVALPSVRKSREHFGFNSGNHLYGCIQNLGKFHPDFDEVLADILRRDPNGIVVAAQDPNGFSASILRARWQANLPDVASRIAFTPPLSQPDYLSLLAECDVLLDPIHFGGVTTTYDAVALAQPLITLPTEFHRGRYTQACLKKIGIPDTIARDRDDYVNLAVQLATDRHRRQELRERLRVAAPAAFEDQGAVVEHERIFEELLRSGR